MRRYYDIIQMDDAGAWAERLGFWRVITTEEWAKIDGKKGAARKRARNTRKTGKLPVYIAESIEAAKEGSWVENSVLWIRTKIDMQVARIMKEKNVAALITLDWLRERRENIRYAAKAVQILHKARVPILLGSGARSVNELRGPRDIASVGKLLGMPEALAVASVSDNWEAIL